MSNWNTWRIVCTHSNQPEITHCIILQGRLLHALSGFNILGRWFLGFPRKVEYFSQANKKSFRGLIHPSLLFRVIACGCHQFEIIDYPVIFFNIHKPWRMLSFHILTFLIQFSYIRILVSSLSLAVLSNYTNKYQR